MNRFLDTMPHLTRALIRKRAEHNEGMISTLEEISLHQVAHPTRPAVNAILMATATFTTSAAAIFVNAITFTAAAANTSSSLQEELEGIREVLGTTCRKLKIVYLQNNIIPKMEGLNKLKD